MTSPLTSPADRSEWRPRDAVIAILAGLAASLAMLAALGPHAAAGELFAFVVPAQALGTVGAVTLLARRRKDWRKAFAARIEPGDAVGLLIGAGLQIGLAAIAYLLIVEVFDVVLPTQEVVAAAAEAIDGGERALVVMALVILAPVSEELVFRGILLGALRRTRGDRTAVIVSAVTFSLLHLLDPNALLAAPFLFVVGIVAGRQVIATGRLGRAVAIHAGFNLITVLALLTA
ncbi:MAG: CPBP family intramembrane glutamic endopeptidase [Acidimicrobiia bacterium]